MIIEQGIFFCYVRLLEILITQNYFTKYDVDLIGFKILFVESVKSENSNNQFYFDDMVKKLKNHIFANLACVPIGEDKQRWLKPNDPQLYFTNYITNFLAQKSNGLDLKTSFAKLFENLNTPITFQNWMASYFNVNQNITTTVLLAIFAKNNNFANKAIDKTPFKTIEILYAIFEFCKINDSSTMNNKLQFLLTSDQIFKNINPKQPFQALVYDKMNHISSSYEQFLHPILINILCGSRLTRKITLTDLPMFYKCIRNSESYSEENSNNGQVYFQLNIPLEVLEDMWKITDEFIACHCHKK